MAKRRGPAPETEALLPLAESRSTLLETHGKGFFPLEEEFIRLRGGLVAGMDEAGRGCFAGPVTIGLAIFPSDFFQSPCPADLKSLNDSKKIAPAKRDELFVALRRHLLFGCAIHISSRLVDRMGINGATEFALDRALHRLSLTDHRAGEVLMDGNYRFQRLEARHPSIRFRSVVKGDSTVFSIAAASILAKVSRDRRMLRYAEFFPGYGMEIHKGYGTALHREAIRTLGLSAIHRRSYKTG